MNDQFKVVWVKPGGEPIACEEKLRILTENLSEVRQVCQDAFEDAILMGCDEEQVRTVFAGVIASLKNPYTNLG